MTCNLKSKFKSILLAGLALAAVTSVQAQSAYYVQGHLLAGFSSGTGNDLVVDLGTPVTALTDGNTWNLDSLLVGNLATIANVSWGVVGVTAGGYNSSSSKVYATATPEIIQNVEPLINSSFNSARTDVNTIGDNNIGFTNTIPIGDGNTNYGYLAASDSASWSQQTTAAVNWGGDFFNPNTKGATNINFYTLIPAAIPKVGIFTLSSLSSNQIVITITNSVTNSVTNQITYNRTLTFNTVSTPTPPTITLNTPINSATYAAYANIPLSATVVSNSNPITSVQFFNGASLLATVTTPPYTATWSFVAPGTYPAVSAQAVYGSGTVTSSVVSVTVNALVKPVVSAPVKNGSGFSFSFTGPNGQPYTVLTTTNVALPVANWTVALTNVAFGVSGTASYTNAGPTDPQRYYKVKSP